MDTNSREYNAIDLIKLIMAVFVIAIHTHPMEYTEDSEIKTILLSLFECAVPFFFLSSGFLLMRKINLNGNNNQTVIIDYIKKIIRMYLIASVCYMPLAIHHYYVCGFSPIKSVLLYLRGLFLIGENYNSWMLWYLLSSIYALLFIYILDKLRLKFAYIVLFGTFIFYIGLLITQLVESSGELSPFFLFWKNVLSKTIINGRIFKGFLYIPLGMLIAKKQINYTLNILLAVGGFILTACFDGIFGETCLVICSVGIFMLSSSVNLKSSPVYMAMRRVSTIVYFSHMYI